jgi:hypothetical protein
MDGRGNLTPSQAYAEEKRLNPADGITDYAINA